MLPGQLPRCCPRGRPRALGRAGLVGRTEPLLGIGEAQAPGEGTAVAEALAWEPLQDLQQPQTDSLVTSNALQHLPALLCTPACTSHLQVDKETPPLPFDLAVDKAWTYVMLKYFLVKVS